MAHTNSSCYILITESSGMQRNSPFRGLVYREIFFQKSFLAKIRSYIYWIPSGVLYLATSICLAKYNLNCDFSVNPRNHGAFWTFP